jgi:uncharacterized SAM-binding protein YcdF (DUF218 family)
MKKSRTILVLIAVVFLPLLALSGRFLVLDQPGRSDVIVVLAGETEQRPARGLELLDRGFAPRLILDVPADFVIYRWHELELARQYVQGLPQAVSISICPIHALSTKAEAQDVAPCLKRIGGQRVLLVTSDFHTRRALSTFRRVLPGYDFRVAAAYDAGQFGLQWWRRRQWAKVNFDEWMRLLWWQVVERWL